MVCFDYTILAPLWGFSPRMLEHPCSLGYIDILKYACMVSQQRYTDKQTCCLYFKKGSSFASLLKAWQERGAKGGFWSSSTSVSTGCYIKKKITLPKCRQCSVVEITVKEQHQLDWAPGHGKEILVPLFLELTWNGKQTYYKFKNTHTS